MNRLLLWTLVVCALVRASAVFASSLAGAAGVESFQALGGSGSRAVLGLGVADFGRVDALGQAARYEDEWTGTGWSFTAGGGVTLSGPLRARVRATRTLGDSGFSAWQFRAGPELRFGDRAMIAASYETDAIADSARTRGLTAEGLLALAPKVTARASSSWARAGGAGRVVQAAVGGIWRAAPHLALSLDAGWLSSEGSTQETFPIGGAGGGLPILGGSQGPQSGSRTSVTKQSSPTLLLGARVIFP